MSDTELVDWVERNEAQIWHNRKSGNWTVQVCLNPGVIQPTRPSLREAIQACMEGLLRI